MTAAVIVHGERAREYVVERLAGGIWKALCQDRAIGHNKIGRLEPVRVSRVQLRCSESMGQPLIQRFVVYDRMK